MELTKKKREKTIKFFCVTFDSEKDSYSVRLTAGTLKDAIAKVEKYLLDMEYKNPVITDAYVLHIKNVENYQKWLNGEKMRLIVVGSNVIIY